jgi:CRP/FNR family transcriptional regulator, cyclic AMP receptor protein
MSVAWPTPHALMIARDQPVMGSRLALRGIGGVYSGMIDKVSAAAHESADGSRRRALFTSHPVLSCLSAEELDHVLGFVVAQRYDAGEAMFRKGDVGQSMMLITAGKVKVSASGPDGREAVLAVLGEGEILGEMAILDNKPRSADATALEACEVLVLRQRDFLPFLERNPVVTTRLLGMISERLRRTSELLEDRMLRHLPGRLAKALLDLGNCGQAPCPPGTRIPLAVRQRVFASLLGTTRESLNKLLHVWQKEGLVRLERGSVVLERPDDLARLVDS